MNIHEVCTLALDAICAKRVKSLVHFSHLIIWHGIIVVSPPFKRSIRLRGAQNEDVPIDIANGSLCVQKHSYQPIRHSQAANDIKINLVFLSWPLKSKCEIVTFQWKWKSPLAKRINFAFYVIESHYLMRYSRVSYHFNRRQRFHTFNLFGCFCIRNSHQLNMITTRSALLLIKEGKKKTKTDH